MDFTQFYTARGLKVGIMPRRRPQFKPGFAGAEIAKLKKFSDARKVNSKRRRHCQKPNFEFICV
jgi:hypothetical protein